MRQEFRNVRMDWVLESRDHLKIRINILENDADAGPGSLSAASREAAELEQDILRHRPPRAEKRAVLCPTDGSRFSQIIRLG